MDELNSPTPAAQPAWRARVAAIWARLGAAWERLRGAQVLLVLVGLPLAYLSFVRVPGGLPPKPAAPQPDAAATLAQRVTALETRVNALSTETATPEPSQDRSPDPALARPGVPRAALRPTPLAAPAAAQAAWGTTDLDREIDDFTRSINQPEQAK